MKAINEFDMKDIPATAVVDSDCTSLHNTGRVSGR
jgi:tartrate dehydratase beta subunit/fumarate hydratase class I family protein